MKKFIVFILSVVYFISSAGATVHLHYCMDKFVASGFADQEGDRCGNCGMEKDGNCCKDEHKFIKNTADQKTTESVIQLKQVNTTSLSIAFFGNNLHYTSSTLEKYPTSHAPPLLSDAGLNILNCVFRI